MRIDKVKWITARSCGKQKWHSFASSLGWKGNFLNSTLPHKMCPRKQTTEPKLLILVSSFSGEVTSYTDTSYCIHILREVYAVPFFMGHPVYALWQEGFLWKHAFSFEELHGGKLSGWIGWCISHVLLMLSKRTYVTLIKGFYFLVKYST